MRRYQEQYLYFLVDEYQDTNRELADAIVKHLIDSDYDVIVGLFGDHWQKIYGSRACGLIEDESIIEIG